jgi:hypothetical protein
MLEAREMNMLMRENRARLAAEFEAEYPEIVKVLEEKILESAKKGLDSVYVSFETELDIANWKIIGQYLANKNFKYSHDYSFPESKMGLPSIKSPEIIGFVIKI